MSSFSDYLEDKILRHVFTNTAYTSPTTIFVALYTTAPTDAGGGTEVSTAGTGYTRRTATFTVSGTNPTLATNNAAIEFPTATANYGTVTAVGLFDASTAGNLLAYANLTTARTVNTGDIFRINTGDLDVTLA
jgi:hypothetical protein